MRSDRIDIKARPGAGRLERGIAWVLRRCYRIEPGAPCVRSGEAIVVVEVHETPLGMLVLPGLALAGRVVGAVAAVL